MRNFRNKLRLKQGSFMMNMVYFVIALNIGLTLVTETGVFEDIQQYDRNSGATWTEATCTAAGGTWQSTIPIGCSFGQKMEKAADDELNELLTNINKSTYQDQGVLNTVFDTSLGTLGDVLSSLTLITSIFSRAVMTPFDWMSADAFVQPRRFTTGWNRVITTLNAFCWFMYTLFFVQLISNRRLE